MIRVLIAKVGLDGHDVGARLVALGLRDAGMEVVYTGLRRTPEQLVRAAIEEDVDVIGVSTCREPISCIWRKSGVCSTRREQPTYASSWGGVIPPEDLPALEQIGVSRVFDSGTPVAEIADYISQLA